MVSGIPLIFTLDGSWILTLGPNTTLGWMTDGGGAWGMYDGPYIIGAGVYGGGESDGGPP